MKNNLETIEYLSKSIHKISIDLQTINYLSERVTLRATIIGNGNANKEYIIEDSLLLFDLLKVHKNKLQEELQRLKLELTTLN